LKHRIACTLILEEILVFIEIEEQFRIVPGLCRDRQLRKTWPRAHGHFAFHDRVSRAHDPLWVTCFLDRLRAHDLVMYSVSCPLNPW
jgi:hypothetical protein